MKPFSIWMHRKLYRTISSGCIDYYIFWKNCPRASFGGWFLIEVFDGKVKIAMDQEGARTKAYKPR